VTTGWLFQLGAEVLRDSMADYLTTSYKLPKRVSLHHGRFNNAKSYHIMLVYAGAC